MLCRKLMQANSATLCTGSTRTMVQPADLYFWCFSKIKRSFSSLYNFICVTLELDHNSGNPDWASFGSYRILLSIMWMYCLPSRICATLAQALCWGMTLHAGAPENTYMYPEYALNWVMVAVLSAPQGFESGIVLGYLADERGKRTKH